MIKSNLLKKTICYTTLALTLAATGCSKNSGANSAESSTAAKETTLETTAETTTETEVTATAESEAPADTALDDDFPDTPVYSISGSGDDIVTGFSSDKYYKARVTKDGNRHFSIQAHYGDTYDLLVNNSDDSYTGYVLIEPVGDYIFEINAQGNWTIDIYELGTTTKDEFIGTGDCVTPVFIPTSNIYQISCDTNRHIAVMGWKSDGTYDLLINQSESYEGKVLFKNTGDYSFFEINSKDDWSICHVDSGNEPLDLSDVYGYSQGGTSSAAASSARNVGNTVIIEELKEITAWLRENKPEELFSNYQMVMAYLLIADDLKNIQIESLVIPPDVTYAYVKLKLSGREVGSIYYDYDESTGAKSIEIISFNETYALKLFTVQLFSIGVESEQLIDTLTKVINGETITVNHITVSYSDETGHCLLLEY